MNTKELFAECLAQATTVMGKAKPSQFGDPTPDTEWDVRTLISHMLYELAWVPDILGGKTVGEVGTKYDDDLIGDDLSKNWRRIENDAQIAVRQTNLNQTIHLSYGD